ncbi:uncharacterized protein LOC133312078 [Gastrolobium bilobum]|uniref:uncharacterized protein LOC133312078 n=1 Tax=Gastrolobium bilobum TaxID=150636 RepID=UPI002AAF457B|nr:uncharacterized protein LOC133312078 [Gastrolobium bilobum]
MSLLFWNCRGAAKSSLGRSLKMLGDKHNVCMVILIETRTGSVNSRRLLKKLKFDSSIFEEANGFFGGIWILMDGKRVKVQLLSQSKQFIHMAVTKEDGHSFICTAVYGSPREEERSIGEKKGGSQPDINKCDRFSQFLNDRRVDDLSCSGPLFIWQGPKWNHLQKVYKKLDRVVGNLFWRTHFEDAKVRVLPRHHSDHNLILVKTSKSSDQWQDRPFRFIASWLDHPTFNDLMLEKWDKNEEFTLMQNGFVQHLRNWNKEVYGNIGKRKNNLLRDISSVQLQRSYEDCQSLQDLEMNLQNNLDLVLEEEEMLWFQKSRHHWIVDGDKNTRFYHLKTVIRRSTNKIVRLKNENNQWIENSVELREHVCNYYKKLFKEEVDERRWLSSTNNWFTLSQEVKEDMIKLPPWMRLQSS